MGSTVAPCRPSIALLSSLWAITLAVSAVAVAAGTCPVHLIDLQRETDYESWWVEVSGTSGRSGCCQCLEKIEPASDAWRGPCNFREGLPGETMHHLVGPEGQQETVEGFEWLPVSAGTWTVTREVFDSFGALQWSGTFTIEVTAACRAAPSIFADGFEGGSPIAWSSLYPPPGRL